MSERLSATHATDRIERSLEALSPATRSVVDESVRRRSDLSPVLVRTVGTAAGEPQANALLIAGTAVSFLEAHARIRIDLLDPDCERYDTPRERDVAILASDHLHASAHETLGGLSLPADQWLSCYRLLTEGSTSLAERLLADVDAAGPDAGRLSMGESGPSPRAVLAGTGSALGAAVSGASEEVIVAMRTYGESLTTAVEVVASSTDEPFDRLCSVLAEGRPHEYASSLLATPRDGEAERHLETAREALSELPDSPASTRLERATNLFIAGVERSSE